MLDMRGPCLAAVVLLAVGVVVLRVARPRGDNQASRWWLPLVAFLCGPLAVIGWFLVDVFLVAPYSYVTTSDLTETFVPFMAIGVISGTLGAIVLGIADRIRLP